jgi:hypothetical protein
MRRKNTYMENSVSDGGKRAVGQLRASIRHSIALFVTGVLMFGDIYNKMGID